MEISDKNRKLLLKALFAYLPYDVKVKMYNGMDTILTIGSADLISMFYGEEDEKDYICRPYLRKMEDMTREEIHELRDMFGNDVDFLDYGIHCLYTKVDRFSYEELFAILDYFFSRHLDVFGLIPKGLAYNIKTIQ